MKLTLFLMLAIGQPGEQFIVTDHPAPEFIITDRNPWLPPPPAAADPRPVLTAYSATWCALCPTAKADLEAANKQLPFRIEWIDVTNTTPPPWCDALPGFLWTTHGKQWYATGWKGVKNLVERYNATRAPPSPPRSHQSHPSHKSHQSHS